MTTPSEELHVTLVQTELHWENREANLAMLEEKIWQIKGQTDLIILPEMFSTGFTMNAKNLAEPMNLTTFKWIKQQAAQTKAVVVGSYIVQEKGQYFNRLIWMQPDGNFFHYDKRHLFRMANEHQYYTAGQKLLITQLKGWKFCPLVCYDLRFPVWSRNIAIEDEMLYDCLIYVANFPQARAHAWNTLLRARAIENLSYCIGVNRTGQDGNGIHYSGESAVIDMKGNELFYKKEEQVIETVILKYADLQEFRAKFPAYMDADQFQIFNLIESTITELIGQKFQLFDLDDLEKDFSSLYGKLFPDKIRLAIKRDFRLMIIKAGFLDLTFERETKSADKYLRIMMETNRGGPKFFIAHPEIKEPREFIQNWKNNYDKIEKPIEFTIIDACYTNSESVWNEKYFYS